MKSPYWMTDDEIRERQRQRAAAEKPPLYQRLLEWPVALLIYAALAVVAPGVYIVRFAKGELGRKPYRRFDPLRLPGCTCYRQEIYEPGRWSLVQAADCPHHGTRRERP